MWRSCPQHWPPPCRAKDMKLIGAKKPTLLTGGCGVHTRVWLIFCFLQTQGLLGYTIRSFLPCLVQLGSQVSPRTSQTTTARLSKSINPCFRLIPQPAVAAPLPRNWDYEGWREAHVTSLAAGGVLPAAKLQPHFWWLDLLALVVFVGVLPRCQETQSGSGRAPDRRAPQAPSWCPGGDG
jgi:hypothetical protein